MLMQLNCEWVLQRCLFSLQQCWIVYSHGDGRTSVFPASLLSSARCSSSRIALFSLFLQQRRAAQRAQSHFMAVLTKSDTKVVAYCRIVSGLSTSFCIIKYDTVSMLQYKWPQKSYKHVFVCWIQNYPGLPCTALLYMMHVVYKVTYLRGDCVAC